ncbi:MAG TPA: helix-turn-helix transcriptional regulator [Xanthobacteraceae bacterium]
MITNERQYRITKAEADRFRQTLNELTAQGDQREGVHPILVRAERDALRSQLEDLMAEVREYEALKAGGVSIIKIDSFSDLAEGLIKARIAAGLSQKALAERLHIKEQQVQRYEAERYASASLQRLQEVAQAIGVQIRKEILMPLAPRSFRDLTTKLQQVGLDRDFLLSRLLPSPDAAKANGDVLDSDDALLTAKTGEVLGRIFGWSHEALLGAEPLTAPRFAAAEARFKMPARRAQEATSLYAAYANYLAVILVRACEKLPKHRVPTDPEEFRRALVASYGVVTGNGAALSVGSRYTCAALKGSRNLSRRVLALRGTQCHRPQAGFEA